MAFKYDVGYLYAKALIGMGYTQVSVTGISSMFSQEEFENDVSIGSTTVYPDVETVKYEAKKYATQQCWYEIRGLRNALLRESDYVTSISIDSGVEVSTAWKNYRQALRDLPSQSDVNNIVWPTHPEGKQVGFNTGSERSNEFF